MRTRGGGIFVGGQSEARALKRAADVDPAIKPQVEQAIMQATGERQSFDAIIAALEREEAKQEKHDLGEDEIDRLDLTIEPYSMERTDDGIQQMRLQQMAEIVPTLAEMFAQFPFLEADNIMRQVGDWTNIPGLEQFVNMEKLAAFQQMTMGAQFRHGGDPAPRCRVCRGISLSLWARRDRGRGLWRGPGVRFSETVPIHPQGRLPRYRRLPFRR